MTSEYLNNKYLVLKAISEEFQSFDDILWYTEIMPVRIRGILRYFLSRNDISKYSQKPSLYMLTDKGSGKLEHWEKTLKYKK